MSKTDLIRNEPSPEGAALGKELARLCVVELEKIKKTFPNHAEPCNTCAFREGTYPNRCVATLMDATKCIMENHQFNCHESANNERPCVGWCVMASSGRAPIKVPWEFS